MANLAGRKALFSLLVSGNGERWETPPFHMDLARFKEYSGAEAEAISPSVPETLLFLEQTPALLMYELGAQGVNRRLVRHGRLRNITPQGSLLSFDFEPDPTKGYLDRGKILQFAEALGMHRFEHHRTHWAVKDGALPNGLLDAASSEPPVRTVGTVMAEYAEAKAKSDKTYLSALRDELEELPGSVEKAAAWIRMCDAAGTPELYPLLGVGKKGAKGREAVAAVLAYGESGAAPSWWPFSLASFLALYGSPTENNEVDEAARGSQAQVIRLVAAGNEADWPTVEEVATTLWRCAQNSRLDGRVRRGCGDLVAQLARRQNPVGFWEGPQGPDMRATAIAAVALVRLGDDKHRGQVIEAVRFLLGTRLADGSFPNADDEDEGDVVATVFALEAVHRSGQLDDLLHVVSAADEWLMSVQTALGFWRSAGWSDALTTALVLDHFDKRGSMLPQVDGFLLMARDFFRKAEELRFDGGVNNRRLAAIAVVHAVEMFLYGLFERRGDLGVSAYKDDNQQTIGPREGLSQLQGALRSAGLLAAKGGLAHKDQITSLISKRDGVIHRAHEIGTDELDAGLRNAKSFIENYGAELLKLDLLQ